VILVDTSIWIDHLRRGDAALVRLLNDNAVLAHPSVTGELALGDLHHRDEVSSSLHCPPKAVVAGDDEMVRLVDQEGLHGAGIGYVGPQLLAAPRPTLDAGLWTGDRRLATVTAQLELDHSE
jgi:predicted nucleic acid-binding protein